MPATGHLFSRTARTPWPEALTAPVREILRQGVYDEEPLRRQLQRLADPATALNEREILSLLVKHFFAYVHPGAVDRAVPLSEITRLFELFHAFRLGRVEEVPHEPRMRFQVWGLALRRLGDLPSVGQLMLSLASSKVRPAADGSFLGLDMGAGAGPLLLAMWLAARRRGVEKPHLVGVEAEPIVARRTRSFFRELGVGEILQADPKDPEVLELFRGQDIRCVANETIPVVFKRLGSDEFLAVNEALFERLGEELRESSFFPEAVTVHNARLGATLELTARQRFEPPREYRRQTFYPRTMRFGDVVSPLEIMGQRFYALIPPRSLRILPRRW